MSEQRPLQTPGEMLAEGRQRLSSTVEQVATSTKIPIHILKAIELDEYHKISDPLYIKSFLRTYAQHVGLNHETVLQVYEEFSGQSPESTVAAETVWEEEVKIQRVGLPWGKIGAYAAVVAVLICVGLFLALRGCGNEQLEVAPIAQEQTEKQEPPADVPEESEDHKLQAEDVVLAQETAAADPLNRETEVVESQMEALPETAAVLPDTLALGWQQGTDPVVPVSTPVQLETAEDDRPAPPQPDRVDLDSLLPADPDLAFADDLSWPLVMRLQCSSPVGVAVQRDAERSFRIVFWPDDPTPLAGNLDGGVEHGRAYAVPEGFVVYWGARDHFILRLDQIEGVGVAVNGQQRDISAWLPGDEMLLDDRSTRPGLQD